MCAKPFRFGKNPVIARMMICAKSRMQLNISGNNQIKMASAGRAWRNDILRQLELRKAAETDPYTDLVNSRKFEQMIIVFWCSDSNCCRCKL